MGCLALPRLLRSANLLGAQHGRAVGFVTSAARHHELGPIGLALIKRNTPRDVPLTAGGIAAAAEVVVDA